MDFDQLKNIWKEENKHLDHRIKLNETLLIKMNMEKITDDFNKIFNLALLGRNLALIYCLVSIIMALSLIKEMEYSLPTMVGGLAMLWSFISHLSIEKPNYYDSIVELQKTICKFRIHMAAHAKYDILITVIWMITFVPICLKYIFNISIYSEGNTHFNILLIAAVVVFFITALSRKTYKDYTQKLKESEAYLAQVIEFEKN